MWGVCIGRGTVALFLAALVAVGAGASVASAATPRGLASRLLARDPGALVGGNTIVGTDRGGNIFGVPNRPNFIIGLGSGETIVGGRGADQLGALGRNATIRGGRANDLIHGGPRHDVIYGGPGNDLIIDRKGTATIYTGTGRDRVLCGRRSVASTPIAATPSRQPVAAPAGPTSCIAGPRPPQPRAHNGTPTGAPTTPMWSANTWPLPAVCPASGGVRKPRSASARPTISTCYSTITCPSGPTHRSASRS